jgi:hypothetical protein
VSPILGLLQGQDEARPISLFSEAFCFLPEVQGRMKGPHLKECIERNNVTVIWLPYLIETTAEGGFYLDNNQYH